MLIILEGQARTGKTSVVNALVEKINSLGIPCEMLKHKRTSDPASDMVMGHLTAAYNMNKIVVADRGIVTEVVMSKHYDREVPYAALELVAIDEGIAASDMALQVLLSAEAEELVMRHLSTGRDFEFNEDEVSDDPSNEEVMAIVNQLGNKFSRAAESSKIRTIFLDSEERSVENIVDEIIKEFSCVIINSAARRNYFE